MDTANNLHHHEWAVFTDDSTTASDSTTDSMLSTVEDPTPAPSPASALRSEIDATAADVNPLQETNNASLENPDTYNKNMAKLKHEIEVNRALLRQILTIAERNGPTQV